MISSKKSPKTFKTGPHLWGMAIVTSASLHMLAVNNLRFELLDPQGPCCDCDPFPLFRQPIVERQTFYLDIRRPVHLPVVVSEVVHDITYLAKPDDEDLTEALNGLEVHKPTTIDLICSVQPNGRLKDCVVLSAPGNALAAATVHLYERHVRLAPLPTGSSTPPKVKLHYNWPANI